MATTNANELEAHLQRALLYTDRLFLALEEIEAGGGLAPALAGRRPQSRDEVLVRLRSARDQLAAALGPVDRAPPRTARPARRSSDGGRTGRRRSGRPDTPPATARGRPLPGPWRPPPACRAWIAHGGPWRPVAAQSHHSHGAPRASPRTGHWPSTRLAVR